MARNGGAHADHCAATDAGPAARGDDRAPALRPRDRAPGAGPPPPLPPLPVPAVPYAAPAPRYPEELEQEARAIVEAAAAAVPEGIPVTTAVCKGSPGPAIVDRIAEGGHDLAVLGSRGRGAIRSSGRD